MEIELYSKLNDPMGAVAKVGEWFAKSGMFRAKNIEQGQMLAFICMVEKKSPTELLRENHILDDGTLAPRSRNVHSRFLERGGDVEWITTGDEEGVEFDQLYAEAVIRFKGRERKVKFSIADARRQQLKVDKENGTWRKNPGNMLRARVLTKGIDLFCPDIVLGVPDDDAPIVEPAPRTIVLDPAPPAAPTAAEAPKPEPKPVKESKVVDAQVVERQQAPTPPTTPTQPQPNGELAPDILTKVEEAIGTHGVAALRWLRGNGRLKDGEGLNKLGAKTAENIIRRPADFIRAVTTWNEQQSKV